MPQTTASILTFVDRFRVERVLGEGGMGKVYLAFDTLLARRVALKAIKDEKLSDPEVRERFRREALALARLNHPFICQLHDWVEQGGQAFLALEYVEGQTLKEAAPVLTLRDKLAVLSWVARALEAAHAKGITHRDLKPTNIMVAKGGVKILDFGLARLAAMGSGSALDTTVSLESASLEDLAASPEDGFLSLTGGFAGTPRYAAPEQILARPVGPPADLFALGVVAWELLSGADPFPGAGMTRLKAVVDVVRPAALRGQVPRGVAQLLAGMLALDPDRRPSAGAVAQTLERHCRRRRYSWLPAAAVAAMAAGWAYTAAMGRGVVADLVKERPARIAVLPFENRTGSATLDGVVQVGLPDLVVAALGNCPRLTPVAPAALAKAFEVLHLDPDRALAPPDFQRLVHATGAKLLVMGSLTRDPYEQKDSLDLTLRDAPGKVRFAERVTLPAARAFVAQSFLDPCVTRLLHAVAPGSTLPEHFTTLPTDLLDTYARGKALMLHGDNKTAEPLLRQVALNASFFPPGVLDYGRCLKYLGRAEAEPTLQWAQAAAHALGDRQSEVGALGDISFSAYTAGDLARAGSAANWGMRVAQEARDLSGEAHCWNDLGIIEEQRGRYDTAQTFYEKAHALAQTSGDKYLEFAALGNLGNLAIRWGRYAEAKRTFLSLAQGHHDLGDQDGEALEDLNAGVAVLSAGDARFATELLGKALSLGAATGNRSLQASAQRNLGIAAQMEGDFPLAYERLEKALDIDRDIQRMPGVTNDLFRLGELERMRGRFPKALEAFKEAAANCRASGSRKRLAELLECSAECWVRLGRPGLAEEALKEASAAAPINAYGFKARAWLAWTRGEATQAQEELRKAQDDAPVTAPEGLREMAELQSKFKGRAGPPRSSQHS